MSEREKKLNDMLIGALELGDDDLADILIDRGADGDKAFIWYAKNYDIEGIRRLKDKVNVNRVDSKGLTAGDYACIGGSAEFCRELFSIDGLIVNCQNLLIACGNNNIEAFREVMKFSVNVNLVPQGTVPFYGGGFSNPSSLILAVKARNLEMVQAIRPRASKALVTYSPGTTNIFGMRMCRENTALHIACYNADIDIVRELKKYEGFDVNALGQSDDSAFMSTLKGLQETLYKLNREKEDKHEQIYYEGFSLIRQARREGKSEEYIQEITDKYNKQLREINDSTTESMKIIKRYVLTLKELLKDKNFNVNARNEYKDTILSTLYGVIVNIRDMKRIRGRLIEPDDKYNGLSYLDHLLIKLYEMIRARGEIDTTNENNMKVIEEINALYTKQQSKNNVVDTTSDE